MSERLIAESVAVECWYCEDPLLSKDAVRFMVFKMNAAFDADAHPECYRRQFDG